MEKYICNRQAFHGDIKYHVSFFFWLVYMYSLDWFPWSGWVFSRSCRVDKKKLGEVFFFSGFLAFFFVSLDGQHMDGRRGSIRKGGLFLYLFLPIGGCIASCMVSC